MNIITKLLGVLTLGLLVSVAARGATYYYDKKLQVDGAGIGMFTSTTTQFKAVNYDLGQANASLPPVNERFLWLTNLESPALGHTFNLGGGKTFAFSGHYNLTSSSNTSFGIYLIDASSQANGFNNDQLFLMNASSLRITKPGYPNNPGTALNGYYTGNYPKTGSALQTVGTVVPGLDANWTLTYTPGVNGGAPSLLFAVNGAEFDIGTITENGITVPNWDNIAVGFRIYNANATLTLSNLNYTIVPEPSTLALLGLGAGLLLVLWRKKTG